MKRGIVFASIAFRTHLSSALSSSPKRTTVYSPAPQKLLLHDKLNELKANRWTRVDRFMIQEDVDMFALDLEARYVLGHMHQAGIKGRSVAQGDVNARMLAPSTRLNHLKWLDGTGDGGEHGLVSSIERALWNHIETLRVVLAEALELPLERDDTELMYARYPEGGYYRRHMDSHLQGTPGFRPRDSERRVSFILYLPKICTESMNDIADLGTEIAGGSMKTNELISLGEKGMRWESVEGGELRLWPALSQEEIAERKARGYVPEPGEEGQEVTLPPTPGSLTLFLSNGLPHEVLRTTVVRRAVVGWFRVRSFDTTH